MVLTFQLAKRKTGSLLFLSNLPGAIITVYLLSKSSKLQAPNETGIVWLVSTLLAGGFPA